MAESNKLLVKKTVKEIPYNFSWFLKNRIAAMACPDSIKNLYYLVDIGVNHLVTLSPETMPPMWRFEEKMKWSQIMIEDFSAPTKEQIVKFVEICERAEIRDEVIGVHCRQGRGRTGTMLACYLVHSEGMAPERAMFTIREQRPGSCETYEQEESVYHYYDSLRGTVTQIDHK